jgi:hypothetical protein
MGAFKFCSSLSPRKGLQKAMQDSSVEKLGHGRGINNMKPSREYNPYLSGGVKLIRSLMEEPLGITEVWCDMRGCAALLVKSRYG